MTEEAARLERIITDLIQLIRDVWPEEDRAGIDEVVNGFDVGKEDDDE